MYNIITSSPWIWTGLVAAMVLLPILIHLINRLRHKKVRWAAMEFLLASQQKNSSRIRLKQWLLLLARIACLLLLLMTIGQVGCDNNPTNRFLGDKITHHYVIVDDSLSMGEEIDGQTALDRATESIILLAGRLSGLNSQRLTLLTYSQAITERSPDNHVQPQKSAFDRSASRLLSVRVDRDIQETVSDELAGIDATFLAVDATQALSLVTELIQKHPDENASVYLFSDFRSNRWKDTEQLKARFSRLETMKAAIHLVRCVDRVRANLSITALRPAGNVRVAGIPLMMELQITNHSDETVRQVKVDMQSATYPDEATENVRPDEAVPRIAELPTLLLDQINPQSSVTRQFPVYFAQPGQHAIRASLQTDSLPGDDTRWSVTRFSTSKKVIVIHDGESAAEMFVSLALAPSGMTGLQVERHRSAWLRDIDSDKLGQIDSIFLLDVPQLDENAVQNLTTYVRQGGGVAFFSGPNTNFDFFNESLYSNGNGVYPVPLERRTSIPENSDAQVADIVPDRHPIFSSVIDVDYSPLDLVQVQQVCQPPLTWNANSDPNVSVLATVRGNADLPLVIEKRVGSGRVIAVTTSPVDKWCNWPRNPTFPTTLLLMQDYIAAGRDQGNDRTTGLVRTWNLPPSRFAPTATFVAPSGSPQELSGLDRTVWETRATINDQAGAENSPGETVPIVALGRRPSETSNPGVHEAWLQNQLGEMATERFALNVDPSESQLELASRQDLARVTSDARIVEWQKFDQGTTSNRGTGLVRFFLVILAGLLLVEQWLAYSNSFHPTSWSNKGNRMGTRKGNHNGHSKISRATGPSGARAKATRSRVV